MNLEGVPQIARLAWRVRSGAFTALGEKTFNAVFDGDLCRADEWLCLRDCHKAVSYTHLTLPTILRV